MPVNVKAHTLGLIFVMIIAPGCATPLQSQPEHTTTELCGPLDRFILDIHRLNIEQQQALLSDLIPHTGPEDFCERLKTGLALSQVSRSVEEDERTIKILNEYRYSRKLNPSERKLVTLLIPQAEERKRLHGQLDRLSTRLTAEQTLSQTKSVELLQLQQKLNQLQKLESDINETEKSISPAATDPPKDASENTDS